MRQQTLLLGAVLAALTTAPLSPGAGAQGAAPRPLATKAEFDRWATEPSNWGRWGRDDQRGALNLITPAKRREAAALVKEGVAVSLAVDANEVKSADNPNPYERSSDGLGLAVHDFALAYLGVHVIDNCDLTAVAAAAAARKRWEFQLIAAPPPILTGTGSQINPIAVF
jgi:hypothetical protein